MRVFSLFALAYLSVVAADRGFKIHDGSSSNEDSSHGPKRIKTAVNFGNAGAKIDVCPTGNCTAGQMIRLSLSRLEEFDATGKSVARAENFNKLDARWAEITELDEVGAAASSTSFSSVINVGAGGKAGTVNFTMVATIYHENGTAYNGDQEIDVPAGAMKFSVSIDEWPFESENNTLRFGVKLKARGKDGKDRGKPSKRRQGPASKHMERVDMGDGMFMDAPSLAVIDGNDTAISSSVEGTPTAVEFVWEFPYFAKTLYYDPVTGATDGSEDSSTPTPTPTPTTSRAATPWVAVSRLMVLGSLLAGTALL